MTEGELGITLGIKQWVCDEDTNNFNDCWSVLMCVLLPGSRDIREVIARVSAYVCFLVRVCGCEYIAFAGVWTRAWLNS